MPFGWFANALSITSTKVLGDKSVWETIRKLSNGTPEAQLGDYAYAEVEDGKTHFFIVKGTQSLELRIGGKGASAADVPKVREAAKKAIAKL